MNIVTRVSLVIATLLSLVTTGGVAQADVLKLSPQESACLAEACRITSLMNDDKWDEVEKELGTKDSMIATLRHLARVKDWPGIGACRGTRLDKETPRMITFRFGFAPRSNPHEIWLTYTFSESGPSKPSLKILGW